MKKSFILSVFALSAFLMPSAAWAQTTNTSTTEVSRTANQTVTGRIAFKSTTGEQGYRIPSIVRLDENHIVAFADRRPGGNVDIGPKCTNYIVYKLGTKTTTDGKDVWNFGDEQTILAHTTYTDQNNKTQNNAASDAATVYDKEHKTILVISTGGNIAYGSGKTQMVRRYLKYDDTNHTLTPVTEGKWYDDQTDCAKEFSNDIYGLFTGSNNAKDQVTSAFFSSGEICQSRIVKTDGFYRLYAALCTRPNGTKVIYSDDLGKTWSVLVDAKNCPAPKGDESKIAELPDGRLLLSTRMYNKDAKNQAINVHGRYMNVFSYSDNTYTKGYWSQPASTDNTVKWDKDKSSISADQTTTWLLGAGAVNGAVAFVPAKSATDESKKVYIALQSMPARISTDARDAGTDNLTIFWKVFEKPDDYLHVGYNGESNTVDSPSSITTFDPKLMAVQGDPETFRYGWQKFPLNNATKYGLTNETRYSAMVQNGVDGVDLLSEEYRSNDCNDIVYRQLSLNTITGGAYTYVPETSDIRTAYLTTETPSNEAPLPGNVYTVKVRWSVTENGKTTVTEKYLSSKNLTHFYDNETIDNFSLEEKQPTDKVEEGYLWTLQCDPDAYTSGSNGVQQPFFYMSAFSGVGYLGRTKGWNWTTHDWFPNAGANLSPKMNNELKILEIHPEWIEPSKAYAQTKNPMEKVVEGNTLVIQTNDLGGRGALAFALETGENNWLGYSTSNASWQNDDIIKGNENNSVNQSHLGDNPHLHWSTDIIFTRVTQNENASQDAPYGTFAKPTYPTAPSKEIYLVRSNNGTAKVYKKDDTTGEFIEDYNYYGTIRLPYAVTIPGNIDVYTVDGQLLEKGVYDKKLNLKKLNLGQDRVLPRETPVLLCQQNSEQQNATDIVKKITLTPTAAQKPQSTGFNGTLGEMWFYDKSTDKDTYNSATGDASNNFYYVLGKKNGRVAFYALGPSTAESSKGKYVVPANKAYFVLPASKTGSAKAAPSLDFGFEGMELVTGINGVKTSQSAQETKIYSIGGQYLGKDLNSLPNGIYIVNGEKVVK